MATIFHLIFIYRCSTVKDTFIGLRRHTGKQDNIEKRYIDNLNIKMTPADFRDTKQLNI